MTPDERASGGASRGRIRRTVGDVRALGWGAPLRAGYEASKRLGGHTLVFGRMVPTTAEVVEGLNPFTVPDVPDAVRKRTIDAADRIAGGRIELFGRSLQLDDPPDWHGVIHADAAWPAIDWWKIDLRSERRIGDVKWAWELGRQRHLVILARAAHLASSEPRYIAALECHLTSWIEANPPEVGIHWYSNLEIAIRSLTWLQILALAGDRLPPTLRHDMWGHLRHAGRHLIADLPYTVSTMRNNHLLGDALGLIALGSAFGGTTGDRWRRIGDRVFNWQLRRHMRSDGSMVEDSLSYHRFVLEMLMMRVVLGGASTEVHEAMAAAAQFLSRLGVLDGSVPQYGDWDEGRLMAVAVDPSDVRGSVLLGLALAGDGAPLECRSEHDEVAWFSPEGLPTVPDEAEISGADLGAGIGRAVAGPYTVWLKGGSGPSHGHADLSSVAIAHRDTWLVGDPGTGTYNGPMGERNAFRSSQFHNVIQVHGQDQLVPHRAFRWTYAAEGVVGVPIRFDDTIVMWTVHNAYTRLSPPRRVARVVVVNPGDVVVADHVEDQSGPATLNLPLGPRVEWDAATSVIDADGTAFRLELPEGNIATWRGAREPYAGWWSTTYGSAEPSTLIEVQFDGAAPTQWAIRLPRDERPEQQSRESGGIVAAVVFEEASVRLRVVVGGRTFLRSV